MKRKYGGGLLYGAGAMYNAYRSNKRIKRGVKTSYKGNIKTSRSFAKTKRRGRRSVGYGQGGTTTGVNTVVLRNKRRQGWTKSALKDISERRYQVINGLRASSGVGYQGQLQAHLLIGTDLNALKTAESLTLYTKIYISHAQSDYRMLNNSNGVLKVMMYFCIPRRDSSLSPLSAWTTGNADQSMTGQQDLIGSKPFQSQEFTSLYYVKKVKTIELGPGGTFNQRVITKVNKSYDTSLYRNVEYLRQFTGSVIFVVSGFPANDVTTVSQVSTQATALDVVEERFISYYPIQQKSVGTTYVDNLVKTFTVAGKVYTEAGATEQTGDVA